MAKPGRNPIANRKRRQAGKASSALLAGLTGITVGAYGMHLTHQYRHEVSSETIAAEKKEPIQDMNSEDRIRFLKLFRNKTQLHHLPMLLEAAKSKSGIEASYAIDELRRWANMEVGSRRGENLYYDARDRNNVYNALAGALDHPDKGFSCQHQ